MCLTDVILVSYLISTGSPNGWSAGPGMPLLLQCFLHFLPTDSIMASFLPFYDFHDPNVPSSLLHGVPAAVNLSLQPHYFYPSSQGPMYSVRPWTLCR